MAEPQPKDGANNGSHWLNWCRLCAKDDPRGNVKVDFSKGQCTPWENALIMAARKYFEVHMSRDDELSSVLCTECYRLISELLDFAEHVNKVQAIFKVLRRGATEPNNQLDVAALRQQYGLREGDWTHIIKPSDNEGDIESNNIKEEVIEQEFIDLAGFPREVVPEIESNQLAEEDSIAIKCEPTEVVKEKPIKRPRGRPKAMKTKRPKLSAAAKNTAVVLKKMQQFNKAAVKSKNKPKDMPPVQAGDDTPNTSTFFDAELKEESRASSPISEMAEPADGSSDKEESLAAGGYICVRAQRNCKECGQSYKNLSNYLKHIENGCRKAENSTCKICNKKLSNPWTLKLHMEGMHENSERFICDCCGKEQKSVRALTRHMLVHTEARPFVCPICNAGFKSNPRLKEHLEIHGEPSFVCNICGRKMQTQRTLRMHKRTHTERRKVKCNVCSAVFNHNRSLKTHLIMHTGLRPYLCNYCGQTFNASKYCQHHKRKKHPQEVEQEGGDDTSSHLNVPTLEELLVMTQNMAKTPNEA